MLTLFFLVVLVRGAHIFEHVALCCVGQKVIVPFLFVF